MAWHNIMLHTVIPTLHQFFLGSKQELYLKLSCNQITTNPPPPTSLWHWVRFCIYTWPMRVSIIYIVLLLSNDICRFLKLTTPAPTRRWVPLKNHTAPSVKDSLDWTLRVYMLGGNWRLWLWQTITTWQKYFYNHI